MEDALQPAALELSDVTKDTLAGAISGLAGVAAGQPLDVLRIRQQQPGAGQARLVPLLQSLLAREGPLALFKGLAYPLLTSAFQNALIFQTYGRACRALEGPPGRACDTSVADSARPLRQVALAGAVSGLIQTSVSTPVELLKIRLQLQIQPSGTSGYVNAWGMLRTILAAEGLPGLYRGVFGTAARDIPSFATYFVTFEAVREALDPGCRTQRRETSPAAVLAAGGAAGVACWLSSYPIDVAKTRVQASTGPDARRRGVWSTLKSMAREEGLRSLFHGLPATLGRAIVVNATVFAVYEACHMQLGSL